MQGSTARTTARTQEVEQRRKPKPRTAVSIAYMRIWERNWRRYRIKRS